MRVVFLTFISLFFISSSYSSELNLFTSRHYPSDLILFKKFEEETGVKVNVINAKSKVLEKRLLDEGPRSKGDVLFLADAGALYSAEKKKLFAKYDKTKSLNLVPMSLKNEYWVGITKRARIIFYNPNLVEYNEIRNISYEDLINKVSEKFILCFLNSFVSFSPQAIIVLGKPFRSLNNGLAAIADFESNPIELFMVVFTIGSRS